MGDKPGNPKGSDGRQISAHQDHELSYWSKALKVPRSQLRSLVKTVGKSAKRLRSYLGITKE
jgi:hypothetical protein